MGYIGIRAKPEEIYFAIYYNEDFYLDSIILPKFLNNEEKLSYLRNILIDIFNEFNIKNGSFKVFEGNVRTFNTETFRRIENETIIKETLYSSGIQNYHMLKNANFAKFLLEDKSLITELIKGKRNPNSKIEEKLFYNKLFEFETKIKELKGIKSELQREAIVSAFISKMEIE